MWTTYLAPWKDKKEDLITKIKDGLYVSEMWWGQVNTVTWDFVFKVQSGYKIKDWKLAQRVRWATLSWNWPEMLNNVFGICDDLEFFDWGTCGKWQAMPVSDWTATLWTKLKVSWLN
jgi:TldD protein